MATPLHDDHTKTWKVRHKLWVGFAVMLVLLLAISATGIRAMMYSETFIREDLVRAIDAADGAMESRINHLAFLWGILKSEQNLDDSGQHATQEHITRIEKRFPVALDLLKKSRFVPAKDMDQISGHFALLMEDGRMLSHMKLQKAKLMDALDGPMEVLITSQGPPGGWTAAQVHLLWSYVMAANDFASYGLSKYQDDYDALRPHVHTLRDHSTGVASLLENGDALVSHTRAMAQRMRHLTRSAETLDVLLEDIEKGSADRPGVDDYVREIQQEMLSMTKNTQRQLVLFGILGLMGGVGASMLIARLIVRPLNQVIQEVSCSSSQMATLSSTQEGAFSQQVVSINETNTTLEALGTSSRQTAEQANRVAEGAQRAMDLSLEGLEDMEKTLRGMEKVQQQVAGIAQQSAVLSEQTGQIRVIIDLVSDFASETKLLALNAAVEAVRAGEHGQGFSVLAVEIRKLADESKQSARRINDLVDTIQKATDATVLSTREAGESVHQGMAVTRHTADTFREVVDATRIASEGSQQISMHVRQQSVAIRQVLEAIQSIHAGARGSETGIVLVRTGIQTLNHAAQILRKMV